MKFFAAFALAALVAVGFAQAFPLDKNVTDIKDQAARALFIKSELKLAGFYNALANDAQFVKAATLAVFQQLTVDQAFANEVYALSSAYVQTQVPVVESKPQCKRFFEDCLGWP